MKVILAMLLSIIMISSFSTAFAQESEPIILEQLSPSGQILVKLQWPEVYPHELNNFKISFHDPTTGDLLDDIRLNYNVEISQNEHPIEIYTHNLTTDGTGDFDVMFPEESQGIAEIIVELKASSYKGFATVYDEKVKFSVNVVPEFGILVMIILIVAFVPILLVSKSKLLEKF